MLCDLISKPRKKDLSFDMRFAVGNYSEILPKMKYALGSNYNVDFIFIKFELYKNILLKSFIFRKFYFLFLFLLII